MAIPIHDQTLNSLKSVTGQFTITPAVPPTLTLPAPPVPPGPPGPPAPVVAHPPSPPFSSCSALVPSSLAASLPSSLLVSSSILEIAPHSEQLGPLLKLQRQNGLYHCPNCEYSSPVVTNVRYHFNSKHCMVKPFSCGFCGSTFGTLVQRDNHVRRVHTGERPFRCDRCNRDFFSRNSQLYHSCGK